VGAIPPGDQRADGSAAGAWRGGHRRFRPSIYLDERGIFREILTYDSWDYLRQADVRLDLDTRLAVNRIFRQQEYVDNAVREAVAFLNAREMFDPHRAAENYILFHRLITDLYYQQLAMLENYRRFLEEVGAEGRA
jgi:hypothetical protein